MSQNKLRHVFKNGKISIHYIKICGDMFSYLGWIKRFGGVFRHPTMCFTMIEEPSGKAQLSSSQSGHSRLSTNYQPALGADTTQQAKFMCNYQLKYSKFDFLRNNIFY